MNTHTYTVECDACGTSIEVEVRCIHRGHHATFYEPPEGPEFDWETPESCPECKQTFSTDRQKVISEEIDQKLANENSSWWEERDEGDYYFQDENDDDDFGDGLEDPY